MTAMQYALAVTVAVLVAGRGSVRAQASSDLLPVNQSYRAVLDQDDTFVMLWTPQDDAIEIEVQVGAKGYVGLGFSPNGNMRGADIVLGWVDDAGKVFLHDCYAEGNWAPKVDASQDVQLSGGYQNDTHTVLRFSRPWQTLDINEDYMLGDDTVRIIWAYSNTDPASETDLSYHVARGTQSLYLKSSQLVLPPRGPDVMTWDFLSKNVSVPDNVDTLYWCTIFRMPNVTSKNHIIGYVPLIQEENLQHVHHIILYECSMPDHEQHYEKWLELEGTQCYSANMPPSWGNCASPIIAWAVGSEGEMFPEHVGFPISENGMTTYFMMEMHYDNPNFQQGVVDSSGIRIFYTDNLRQNDAGMITLGHDISPLHIIPPAQKWLTAGYCDAACTGQSLPPEGVKLFRGLLHSHLLGRTLTLRHGRSGKELPPIMKDMNYDFNYQSTRILREEVTVLPGDNLVLECGYDSSNHTKPTFGGLGTSEEMCTAFMSYYPRIDFTICTSQPELITILGALGIEEVTNVEKVQELLTSSKDVAEEAENQLLEKVMSGNNSSNVEPMILAHILDAVNVTAPQEFFNRSLYSILQDTATWADERVTNALQKAVLKGNHSSSCHLRSSGVNQMNGSIVTAPDLEPLPGSLPDVSFMHSTVLDQENNYVLLWTPLEKDIVFEVQVRTKGYVGLGFSPSGGMTGADIIMGWVNDAGEVFLHDLYAEGRWAPRVDDSQDVELMGGYQNDTHTVLRFWRPWDTCDKGQDYMLSDDTVRIIWAYNNNDPANETDLKYHEKRGTKSLYLRSPQFTLPPMGPDVKSWDFLSPNVSLPDNLDTLYWCKIFKMPPTPVKSHLIGFVPLIEEKNAEHVHHILGYECHVPNSDTHFEKWLDWQGTQCYGANMPLSWKYCKAVIIGWAVGGEGEMFPEHAGLPIGEEHGGATYFMMEMHYDNPNLRPGVVDSSGIRIFYTEKLRDYDAGMLMIGHHVSPFHIVPPGQPRFLTGSFCDATCTEKDLPKDGVKVFQGILHSHLLGASIVLRHIRNGQELPAVMKDMSYDFNYQNTRVLEEEVTLLPGDTFITECYYDSSNSSKPTFGGLGTEEEMCLAFITYYPRVNLFSCTSQPQTKNVISALGVEDVDNERGVVNSLERRIMETEAINEQAETEMAEKIKAGNFSEELKRLKLSHIYKALRITAPEKYLNKSVYSILHDEATWQDPVMIDAFQRMTVNGVHISICETRVDDKVTRAKNLVPYPTFRTLRPVPDQCFQSQGGNPLTGSSPCPPFFPFCKNKETKTELFF